MERSVSLLTLHLSLRRAEPEAGSQPRRRDPRVMEVGCCRSLHRKRLRAHRPLQGTASIAAERVGGSGHRSRQPEDPGGHGLELRLHGQRPHRCAAQSLVWRDAHPISGYRHPPAARGQGTAHRLVPHCGRRGEEGLLRVAPSPGDVLSRSPGIRHTAAALIPRATWLKQIFPQMLVWFDNMSTPLVGDLLIRWPELPKLQKASAKTLRKFFDQHNCRSEERIQQRLEEIGQAVPATTDAALLRTGNLCIQLSVQLLAGLRAGIAEFDKQIEAIYQTHPNRFITASLPGAGPALEPRLLAALGTNRERFESASNMACCFGIAPVTESSGKSRWVHWRWACSKFVRQTLHEWANCSIRTCGWARQHYDRQRSKGKGHHASVRSVAFKWIRILFRCWRDRVPYSEQRYLEALRTHGGAPSAPAAIVDEPTPVLSGTQWKSCGDFSKLAKVSS